MKAAKEWCQELQMGAFVNMSNLTTAEQQNIKIIEQIQQDAIDSTKEPTPCGHPAYRDDHCAVMSCSNYVGKAG